MDEYRSQLIGGGSHWIPVLICGLLLTDVSEGGPRSTQSLKVRRNLLDIVLEDYDLDKWPTFHDEGVNVTGLPTINTVWVDIMFISSINVEAMDLTVDMYLNQKWNDKRLQFTESVSKRRLHLKTVEQMRRIWSPDTYIVNAKQANFHHITTENRVVYISHNGDVFYSARITAKVACEMKFHSFPMDNQDCILHLASYAYTNNLLQMVWLPPQEGKPVSYKKGMDLNQFHLTNVTVSPECADVYPDGEYPCLKIYFRFERRVAHHLIQTFLPTVLIVTISWVSFYIQAEAVPARIALGITTLLTMITLNSGTKQGLPPVSYVKAIDVWMGVCTFFVFSAIWEYVIVCILVRRPLGCQRHDPYRPSASRPGQNHDEGVTTNYVPSGSRFIRNSLSSLVIPNLHAQDTEQQDPSLRFRERTAVSNNIARAAAYGHHSYAQNTGQSPYLATLHQIGELPNSAPSNNCSSRVKQQLHLESMSGRPQRAASTPNSHHIVNRSDQVLKVVWEPRASHSEGTVEEQEFHLQTSPTAEQIVRRKKKKIKVQCICTSEARNAQERSKRVDIVARLAYPLMFLFFNLFYWPYYLYWSVPAPLFPDTIPC